MLRILALLLVMTAQAQAGAWPRGKGKTFLSYGAETEQPDAMGVVRTFSTFYGEYGLTDQLTLGLDLGGEGTRMSKAVGFVRWPLGTTDRPTKLAFEMGAGLTGGEKSLRPGLSIGRGFNLWKKSGWMAADSRLVLYKGSDGLLETDLTLGFNPGAKTKVIFQVQSGAPKGSAPYIRLAPSFVYENKPGRHIEIGLTAGIKNSASRGVKIGTWRQF